MIKPRPYQEMSINLIWDYFNSGKTGNPLIAYPTGCHAKGTEILMFNGSIKKVEDIIVGDFLMGPDSSPRQVLSLARGKEAMAKISPTKGTPFIVNANHILSLKTTQQKGYNHRYFYLHTQKGRIENIKVVNYIPKSKTYKHARKLWRTGVEFTNIEWLPITSYSMGIFLGDGGYSHNTLTLTSMDEVILEYFTKEAIWHGGDVRRSYNGSKAITINIRSKIRRSKQCNFVLAFQKLGMKGIKSETKFIPEIYKVSSRENRLNLLAGLIDTDGSLVGTNGYDYISKSEQLAEDVVFVARSLGYAAYVKSCQKSDQHGTQGTYYRVSISGDLSELPVLLQYKKAKPRKQIKSVLVTGFKIETLPEDNYYGFELDKDHLYLTSDFTVHHNTGKSLIPAIFIQRVMQHWPNQKFLMITHVSELIKQNAEVLRYVWPNAPLGIFSAGLKQKQPFFPIVYAGIQSAIRDPSRFGHRDIIFIDEAHLLSDDESSQYSTFIAIMKLINPAVKVIGMTATPFRMGMGLLTEGTLFTDIIHDLTSVDEFNKLIAEGYLCPLIPKRTKVELDVSNVGMAKGDFIGSQLQSAVDKQEITYAGLREAIALGHDRKSWLLFSSGIEHADHIASMLTSFGIDCASVHSKQNADYNNAAISAFKSGTLRAIVNFSKLTTGFNHPAIDLICDFRPTMSIPLHIQKLGRGTRPAQGKENCMVLDFGRNIPRLGPINDPCIPRKKGVGTGEVPVKICEACGTYNHAKVRFCTGCGNEFEFKVKIVAKAGTEDIIRSDLPIVEYFDVDHAIYNKQQKDGKAAYIKVSYFCGMRKFNEFVFPESAKYGKHLFHQWWMQRSTIEPPATTDEALKFVSELRCPKRIRVWCNKKWPEVLSAEY